MSASHDPHADPDDAPHGTRRGYLIGFVLAAALTAIPFWLVMTGALHDAQATALVLFVLALVQILVQAIFFLHLDTRSEGGWTLMASAFTVVIVTIIATGSIWIMYHLNTNMMPVTAPDVSQAP